MDNRKVSHMLPNEKGSYRNKDKISPSPSEIQKDILQYDERSDKESGKPKRKLSQGFANYRYKSVPNGIHSNAIVNIPNSQERHGDNTDLEIN